MESFVYVDDSAKLTMKKEKTEPVKTKSFFDSYHAVIDVKNEQIELLKNL